MSDKKQQKNRLKKFPYFVSNLTLLTQREKLSWRFVCRVLRNRKKSEFPYIKTNIFLTKKKIFFIFRKKKKNSFLTPLNFAWRIFILFYFPFFLCNIIFTPLLDYSDFETDDDFDFDDD